MLDCYKHPPILLRCGNCHHILSYMERQNDNQCLNCKKYFCYKCGSAEPPNIFPYGYNGNEYSCGQCGELLA